ncbi:MAG TPA: GDSL-type esterase/lipase family protein [Geminicoccaceae bacterium]
MPTLRSYSATVDQLGPGDRWRFDEDAGRDALDRAGSLDGTYQGGFAHGATTPIGDGAVAFDGETALTSVVTTNAGGPIRLGFLGDSLVAGYGLNGSEAFPAALTAALEGAGFDIEPVVRGFSGFRSDQILDQGLADELAGQGLGAVVLVIGTNDALQGLDADGVEGNLRQIIQKFQAVGTEVLLTSTFGLWPDEIFDNDGYDTRDPATAAARAAEFEAIYPALAAELGVTLFGEAFVQPVRENPAAFNLIVGGEPDGIHPNAAGVQEIVSRILDDASAVVMRSAPLAEDLLALGEGSVEGWFVPEDVDGVQGLIARGSAGAAADGDFRIFLDQDRLKAVVESSSGAVTLGSAAGAVQPDQAFHVVLAFGAAGVELFLNGVSVDQSGTGFSAAGGTSPLLFGALPGASGTDGFFHGAIDEVAIYHRVLSADQVGSLFSTGAGGGTLIGTRGDDRLIGGGDDDSLRGKSGRDELQGHDGDDRLIGGPGADVARGGAGSDTIQGDDGRDRLFGNGGDDVLGGGGGDDRIRGGGGRDQIRGGGKGDDLAGGAGNDVLEAGRGQDVLRGGAGSDQIFGQEGADQMFGGAGDDLLVGGGGDDRLTGGSGADTFRIERLGDGVDQILDLETGAGADQIDVAGILSGFAAGASDPNDFARLVARGDGLRLQVDPDGQGGDFTTAVRLIGGADLAIDQLVTDGNLNLA